MPNYLTFFKFIAKRWYVIIILGLAVWLYLTQVAVHNLKVQNSDYKRSKEGLEQEIAKSKERRAITEKEKDELSKENDRLKAIVDKLPKDADIPIPIYLRPNADWDTILWSVSSEFEDYRE